MSNKPFLVVFSLVVALYVVLIGLFDASTFWSPDEGCKFIQMVGLKGWGPFTYEVPYPGKTVDPDFVYFPQGTIYPNPDPGIDQTSFSWPPWFPAVSRIPYSLFGLRGLYLLPLLGGLGSLFLVGILARKCRADAGVLALLACGLASPVLFYSVLFWEHCVALGCGLLALALFLAARTAPFSRSIAFAAAGWLALAAACLIRFDFFIFAMALAATFWIEAARRGFRPSAAVRDRRNLMIFSAIAVAVCALLGVYQATGWSGGGMVFPKYLDLNQSLQARIFSLSAWREWPAYLADILINNSANFGARLPAIFVGAALAGLALCISARITRWRMAPAAWILGALLVASASGAAGLSADRFRAWHSLLLPAPWMLAVFLPAASPGTPSNVRLRGWLGRAALSYAALYLASAWLVARADGGPEWGTRFALAAYPLAGICASVRMAEWNADRKTRWRRPLLVVVCLLLGLGGLAQVRGVIEAGRTKRDLRSFRNEIQSHPEYTLVTDVWWLSSALAPVFVSRPMFTLDQPSELGAWISQVGPAANRFLFVGHQIPGPEAFSPAAAHVRIEGQTTLQGMHFMRATTLPPP